MRESVKEPFPIIQSLYLLLIVLFISTVPSCWFFCSIAYSQEIEDEESDDENGRSNLENTEDDSPFDVVIPESAAWSQTINERFDPSNFTVPQGGEVRWTNEDNLDHTITSGNVTNQVHERIYDGRFYSGILESGDSFTYEFTEPGVYSYFCSPHPWMNGYVIVESGDNGAQGTEETSDDEDIQETNGNSDNDEDEDEDEDDDDSDEEEED
jgi:plastocyanin